MVAKTTLFHIKSTKRIFSHVCKDKNKKICCLLLFRFLICINLLENCILWDLKYEIAMVNGNRSTQFAHWSEKLEHNRQWLWIKKVETKIKYNEKHYYTTTQCLNGSERNIVEEWTVDWFLLIKIRIIRMNQCFLSFSLSLSVLFNLSSFILFLLFPMEKVNQNFLHIILKHCAICNIIICMQQCTTKWNVITKL